MIPTLSQYLEHTKTARALDALSGNVRITHGSNLYVVEDVIREEDEVIKVTAICPIEGNIVYFEGSSLRDISLASIH